MLLLLAALCAASISKGLSFSLSSRTAELKLPQKFGRLYRLEATARIKKEDAQAPKRTAKKSKDDRDVFLELITEKLLQKMEYFETHGTGPPEDDEDRSASLSDDQTKLLNGVVRIYCTHSQPNFGMPWQRMKQEFSTSTGFVIDGRRILTNAHAVEYGSLIQVKKRSSEKKYVASVIAGNVITIILMHRSDSVHGLRITPYSCPTEGFLSRHFSIRRTSYSILTCILKC